MRFPTEPRRAPGGPGLQPGRGRKDSIGDAQVVSRRNHVNMIGPGARLALYLGDRHLGGLGKQLGEMALVLRIEVLNQHECHAGIVRQMVEQHGECFQPAGGGSYTNNQWECTDFARFLDGWPHDSAGPTLTSLLYQSPPLPFSPAKTEHVSCHSGGQLTDCIVAPSGAGRAGGLTDHTRRWSAPLQPASRSLMVLPICMNCSRSEGLVMNWETPRSL